jgi:hypothetical protein
MSTNIGPHRRWAPPAQQSRRQLAESWHRKPTFCLCGSPSAMLRGPLRLVATSPTVQFRRQIFTGPHRPRFSTCLMPKRHAEGNFAESRPG